MTIGIIASAALMVGWLILALRGLRGRRMNWRMNMMMAAIWALIIIGLALAISSLDGGL